MNIWLIIICMALVTYIPRALPSVIVDKMKFSPKLEKFLGLIPYTAMAALIFPGILTVDSSMWFVGVIGGVVAVSFSLVKKMSVALVVATSVAAVMIVYAII